MFALVILVTLVLVFIYADAVGAAITRVLPDWTVSAPRAAEPQTAPVQFRAQMDSGLLHLNRYTIRISDIRTMNRVDARGRYQVWAGFGHTIVLTENEQDTAYPYMPRETLMTAWKNIGN